MDVYKESPDSLNIVWVGVSEKHEGHGYGTAAMKGAIQYAKQTGCRQVTLEVPGNSPNARHIYEKLGFKDTGETLGDTDDIWGGLTKMRLDLEDDN
jgi:ribosomal protein S18 acetylase RimI-like enzyme